VPASLWERDECGRQITVRNPTLIGHRIQSGVSKGTLGFCRHKRDGGGSRLGFGCAGNSMRSALSTKEPAFGSSTPLTEDSSSRKQGGVRRTEGRGGSVGLQRFRWVRMRRSASHRRDAPPYQGRPGEVSPVAVRSDRENPLCPLVAKEGSVRQCGEPSPALLRLSLPEPLWRRLTAVKGLEEVHVLFRLHCQARDLPRAR
jgi:hypothetical protein